MTRTHAIPLDERPTPSPDYTPGLGDFAGPEILTLGECARLTRYTPQTIRDAIRKGELPGFIPRGRTPGRTGPGNGYRVYRADLQRWFFGSAGVEIRKEEDADG